MNNLIIIGNGFDLAHEMKTSYTDFLNHIIDSHLSDRNKFNDLIDIDKSIKNRTQLDDHISDPYDLSSSLVKFKNEFFNILFIQHTLNNWCDIEKQYFNHLHDIPQSASHIKKFHKDFEAIRQHLSNYLKQTTNQYFSNSYKYFFEKLVNYDSLILNFNYTNTLNKYNAPIRNLVNIHGELDNDDNPIIFGYAANDEESRDLIGFDDNEYMRNIKKHCYKRTNNENRLREYLDKFENINVFILGHSCGISDKLILNQIFNHPHISFIRTFYYENHESYFNTQVNIDRIMNNDENFKKLVPFENSTRMPQASDNSSQVTKLQKYIDDLITKNQPIVDVN